MLTEKDHLLIETTVSEKIVPEIKAHIPGFLGFLLRKIWPNLNEKIVKLIEGVVKVILEAHLKRK